MVPTTGEALLILLAAVLPGAMFTFGFERQAGAFTVTLADRVLRFVAVSVAFDLLYAMPLYALRRTLLDGGLDPPRFALLWLAVLVALGFPLACGTALGGLYATPSSDSRWRRVRRVVPPRVERRLLLLAVGRDRAPRAWEHVFGRRPLCYARIRTVDGLWIGGLFGRGSYAGKFPYDSDLFIEEAWPVDADGVFGDAPLGYAVYVPAATIMFVEFLAPTAPKGALSG